MAEDMQAALRLIVRRHQDAYDKSFTDNHLDLLHEISREFVRVLKSGNKLLFCGNGGSAADSQHIAAEFIARFKLERRSLPAIALTTDTSILTALANDYDFVRIFERQVEGLGRQGDLLVALTTSGNSPNVLAAVDCANKMGLKTIGFTGKDGGALKDRANLCYIAGSSETSHIQEMHITALHAISEVVEAVFFGN